MEIASIDIAASGLKAQSERLKVISQNIANADSVSETPGGDPYRRKVVTFKNVMDKQLGFETVQVGKVGTDNSDFQKHYDPGNPGAGADGNVMMPNINPLIEMTDMKEAKNAYQANLSVIDISKQMASQTLSLLKNWNFNWGEVNEFKRNRGKCLFIRTKSNW